MKRSVLFAIVMLWVPAFASGAHFETVFDGGVPATGQGWSVIGADDQVIGTFPMVPELQIDTTSDAARISGVYGSIPTRAGAVSHDLYLAFLQYTEFNVPPDGTVVSIIIVGEDPAKSLHLGVGHGRMWYYDSGFNPSAPILDLGPDKQYYGLTVVRWHDDTAFIAGDAFGFDGVTVPLFDYRAAASTRHASIAPIYSQANTLFFGDDSETDTTFVWLGRTVIEYQLAVVPLPSAFVLLAAPLVGMMRLQRRRARGR